jgi:dTDP-4-dehydrorhamnose 3,5-epimerase
VKVTPASLPDVLLIEPKLWRDDRGLFFESFNERKFAEAGIRGPFVQDNHSRSHKNVLRGLHYQLQHAQGKLIRVTHGRVFDVAVDLRKSSPTFGKWTSAVLDGESLNMMWVPAGFAHGYLVLSDSADFLYKTTDFYFPEHERTIAWNDPALGIQWPGDPAQFILSAKDREGVGLRVAEVYP